MMSGVPISVGSFADTVDFSLFESALGEDVEATLKSAIASGVVFPCHADPVSILRQAVAASIRDIETHPRGVLFQEFLRKGPYFDIGEIPATVRDKYLSDADSVSAVTFIHSFMVNSFKGAITELLAVAPCLAVMDRLLREGKLPPDTRLYIGDVVGVRRARGNGILKGADQFFLARRRDPPDNPGVSVVGITEVKSYFPSPGRLRQQIDQHLQRAKRGLRVGGVDFPARTITIGDGNDSRVARITVVPSNWKLVQSFRFESFEGGRRLFVDRGTPEREQDEITQVSDDEWQVVLRWSKEAIDEAAYEMTFQYMGKIGEIIYATSKPKEWQEMTPYEAGRNAATMMLYYAILRCRWHMERLWETRSERRKVDGERRAIRDERRAISNEQRAIAVYNSYGFGYALGMNFRDPDGRREMLWPEDLDEIIATGMTQSGCMFR